MRTLLSLLLPLQTRKLTITVLALIAVAVLWHLLRPVTPDNPSVVGTDANIEITDTEFDDESWEYNNKRAHEYLTKSKQIEAIREAANWPPGSSQQNAYLAQASDFAKAATAFSATPAETQKFLSKNSELKRAWASVRYQETAFQLLTRKIDELSKATKYAPGSPENKRHLDETDKMEDHTATATILHGSVW